ncbi:hypothetical protein D3C78_1357400 [compost metagenome]
MLFKAVQDETPHAPLARILDLRIGAIEHRIGQRHREQGSPGPPEHIALFAGNHQRACRQIRLLGIEPGVFVVNGIGEHSQTCECRNDPFRQPLACQAA